MIDRTLGIIPGTENGRWEISRHLDSTISVKDHTKPFEPAVAYSPYSSQDLELIRQRYLIDIKTFDIDQNGEIDDQDLLLFDQKIEEADVKFKTDFVVERSNADIDQAEIICLGISNAEIEDQHNDTVELISTLARDGDIILVGGINPEREITEEYLSSARSRGDSQEREYANFLMNLKELPQNVTLKGWDDIQIQSEAIALYDDFMREMIELKKEDYDPLKTGKLKERISNFENLVKKYQKYLQKAFYDSNPTMINTIEQVTELKPAGKRIFILAGRPHFSDPKLIEFLNNYKFAVVTPTRALR